MCMWLSCFSVTLERRKVFSRLRQEKLRSAVQLVTGKVRNSRSKLTTSGSNCNHTTLSVNSFTTSVMPATVTGGSAERHKSPSMDIDEGASANCQCHLHSGLKWSSSGTLPVLITSVTTDSTLRAKSKAEFWNRLDKQVVAASSDEK